MESKVIEKLEVHTATYKIKQLYAFEIDMSQVVGSLQRVGTKALSTNVAVENLQSAGGIPLLVSANPEYCFSIETTSFTNGKCLNPYDFRRTCGGSSGGEVFVLNTHIHCKLNI